MATVQTSDQRLGQAEQLIKQVLKTMSNNADEYFRRDVSDLRSVLAKLESIDLLDSQNRYLK